MEKEKSQQMEIVKAEPNELVQADNSPASMMQMALSNGADLASIEKMMELQERWERNEAKKAYVAAMAEFKKTPLKILKDKKVSFNQTNYSHASLGNVTDSIGTELSRHGISASWETKQDQGNITVICTLTHSMGHSESTSLTAPPDSSGKKNNIQAIGSTVAYLQRYTILAITGVATHDQIDDDGRASEVVYITDKQAGQIFDTMNSKNVNAPHFLDYLKVGSVEEIPANRFNAVMSDLSVIKGE